MNKTEVALLNAASILQDLAMQNGKISELESKLGHAHDRITMLEEEQRKLSTQVSMLLARVMGAVGGNHN